MSNTAAELVTRTQEHRDRIQALEEIMLRDFDQVQLEVKHYFAHGTYTRELYIPAGITLTGEIHRYATINIIPKGKIRVVTDQGTHDIEAPHTFVTGPGVKKAGYALEDTVWINVFPWEGEEIADEKLIRKLFTVPNYNALEN